MLFNISPFQCETGRIEQLIFVALQCVNYPVTLFYPTMTCACWKEHHKFVLGWPVFLCAPQWLVYIEKYCGVCLLWYGCLALGWLQQLQYLSSIIIISGVTEHHVRARHTDLDSCESRLLGVNKTVATLPLLKVLEKCRKMSPLTVNIQY